MSTSVAVTVLVSVLLSAAITGLVRRLALRRNWLDVPNERSSHQEPTPRGGGVAIVVTSSLGFLGLWAAGELGTELLAALLGGGLAVALVGFQDDRRSIPAGVRLAVHLAAAAWALAWLGGVPAIQFGMTSLDFGGAGFLLGMLAVGWTVNLFNFMDGIDGLAASEAAFMALSASWLAAAAGLAFVPSASLVFGAACLGFAAWNWPPARIFMGDVGSGYVGYVLAVLALASMEQAPTALFAWLALGAVFFVDATVTLVRRAARGERTHEAHRTHAYQWLARGWQGHRPVTLAVLAFNVAVLLPVAWFCLARPQHAAAALATTLVGVTVLALAAGSGRREASR